jgi:RNA polymerase sigma factor (sigma-70 family)
MRFEDFAARKGDRIRDALVAAYGVEVGAEAAAEAMAYAFENWDRLSQMINPAGYVYRVGQTAARRVRRPLRKCPSPSPTELPDIEPGLVPALHALSEQQRTVVLLVVGFSWRQSEVAELLGLSGSTVHAHLERAISQLRLALTGVHDA